MGYYDNNIVEMKNKHKNIEYANINKKGVYINNEYIVFDQVNIYPDIQITIPIDFIDLPEKIRILKYPSVNHPQVIKTSHSTTTNFAFNLFSEKINPDDIDDYIQQLKAMVQKTNPSYQFDEEQSGRTVQNCEIRMFDFISLGFDEKLYNMMCLILLKQGVLQAVFNCLDRDSDAWKNIAWQVFLSVEEVEKRNLTGTSL